jgi:hypothetical protein
MINIPFYFILFLSTLGAPVGRTAAALSASLALAASSGSVAFLPSIPTRHISPSALSMSAPSDTEIVSNNIVKGWRAPSMTMEEELGLLQMINHI